MLGSIVNIEFRWLRYKRRVEKQKRWVPYFERLPRLGRLVDEEIVILPPPSLQYRLFSTGTQEWTGWMDVPFVREDEGNGFQPSMTRLQAEYGKSKNILTPL